MRLFSKISRPVRFLIVFALLTATFGGAAVLSQYLAVNTFGFTPNIYRENIEIDADLYVSVSSSDIPLEVYTYDGDKVTVEYIGANPLVVELDEFGLRIGLEEDFRLVMFTADKLNFKMKIFLPDLNYRETRFLSASGGISLYGLKSDSISLSSRTGGINLYGVSGFIEADTIEGGVNIEFDEISQISEPVYIKTVSGNVKITAPKSEEYGVELNFSSDGGTFTSDYFGEEYIDYNGDLTLSTGANPTKFTVITGTGNLEFYEKP